LIILNQNNIELAILEFKNECMLGKKERCVIDTDQESECIRVNGCILEVNGCLRNVSTGMAINRIGN
jgi:hypothetical protein